MKLKSALAIASLSLLCLIPKVASADSLAGVSGDGVDLFTVASAAGNGVETSLCCVNSDREINFADSQTVDPLAISTVSSPPSDSTKSIVLVTDLSSNSWTPGQPQISMADPAQTTDTPVPSGLILLGTGLFLGAAFLQATVAGA